MTKRLTLLRHGKTGLSGRYVGSRDVPLSVDGRAQIARLKSSFEKFSFDSIVSSPMLRCRESAEILFPDRALSYDDDLREIDFGRWEGLTFQEIVKNDPEHVAAWAEWSPQFCFPEGECIAHFIERLHKAGSRIATSIADNTLIIAHGGVIRTLLCYYLQLDPSQYLLFQVQKGRFATLDLFDEGAVLTGFNLGVYQ